MPLLRSYVVFLVGVGPQPFPFHAVQSKGSPLGLYPKESAWVQVEKWVQVESDSKSGSRTNALQLDLGD